MFNAALAGKAVAALVAATAPAAFGLTASPTHVTAKAGGAPVVVEIRNTGTHRVTVTTSIEAVGKTRGQCHVSPSAVPAGITVTPASLTLRPDHAKDATVTVARDVPASDVAVVFTTDEGQHKSVRVLAAVAVQLTTTAGNTTAARCVSLRPAAVKGFPAGMVGGAGGAALALTGAGVWLGLRRRRSDPGREGRVPTV